MNKTYREIFVENMEDYRGVIDIPPERQARIDLVKTDLTGNSFNDKNWFFVAGIPRSGTTIISKIISQHPDCICTDEIFPVHKIIDIFTGRLFQSTSCISAQEGYDLNTDALYGMLNGFYKNAFPSKSFFGDNGHSYLRGIRGENITPYVDIIKKTFNNANFFLCIRNLLDLESSYMSQKWYCLPSTPEAISNRIAANYVANYLSIKDGYYKIDFNLMYIKEHFKVAMKSIFEKIGADPDVFDYNNVYREANYSQFNGAKQRWRKDQRILDFLEWAKDNDKMLYEIIIHNQQYPKIHVDELIDKVKNSGRISVPLHCNYKNENASVY